MSSRTIKQGTAGPAQPEGVAWPACQIACDHGSTVIADDEMTPWVRSAVSTLVQEVERLRRDLEASERRVAELARLADSDPLLGMLNGRAFRRELTRAIAHARRYATTLSVIYLDFDGFKAINDSLGHAAGDAVLCAAGAVLEAGVRKSDIVGRLGGDEFAVALIRADLPAAQRRAEDLAAALAATSIDDCALRIAASTGVAELSPTDTAESLIDRADYAMYRRKAGALAGGTGGRRPQAMMSGSS